MPRETPATPEPPAPPALPDWPVHSYYYDDATGYETYDPAQDEDEATEDVSATDN